MSLEDIHEELKSQVVAHSFKLENSCMPDVTPRIRAVQLGMQAAEGASLSDSAVVLGRRLRLRFCGLGPSPALGSCVSVSPCGCFRAVDCD